MKRTMFHKFTNFIQHAVDTFSPNVVPLEEFVYHWKSVTSYFVDNKDMGVRIEETALPEHLSSMLRIIQEEESDLGEAGTTGACLEYVLQHRLLETLYTLGRTDYPPGMKQIVLIFFTKLLSRISHPLLPHINVHRAVQRLVKVCGETQAGPTEKEEIEFLCTVCAKIKSDPYLVNFFIEINKNTAERVISRNQQSPAQAFSLVNALLSLSHSEDARVSVKACEGLMLCASLPEQPAATVLTNQTQFCSSIATTLCQLYEKLPSLVSPESVEGTEAKWGFDNIMERNEKNSFAGKRQIIFFLSWLDYCDQLIAVANPDVGVALASEIHKQFFTDHLLPSLMQPSESGIIVTTAYTTRCLRTVCSSALLREFGHFLLGTDRGSEQLNSTTHDLTKRLLERCNHLCEEVCITTLKLFDTLFQKEDEHIYHSLLLRNLLGRGYLRQTMLPSQNQTESLSNPSHSSVQAPTRGSDEHIGPDNLELAKVDAATISEKDLAVTGVQVSDSDNSKDPLSSVKENNSVSENLESSHNTKDIDDQTLAKQPLDDRLVETVVGSDIVHTSEADEQKVSTEEKDNVSTPNMDPAAGHSAPSSVSSSLTSSPCTSESISSSTPSRLSSFSDLSSPIFGRFEVHKVVNCFLSLLPEEAKSSYQTADSGYDMYLKDAHRQFSIQETVCKDWAWPKKPVALSEYATEKFYEGSFLHMLLDKLQHMLDQSYSVNLLLTALIAKVAIIPHPNLHEFLLDPFLPTGEGTRTLYSMLVKVTGEIKQNLTSDPAFTQKLLLARKQLLGLVPTIHRFEDQGRMEAIIVLEEFCKELSAITFVKHHAAVTRF